MVMAFNMGRTLGPASGPGFSETAVFAAAGKPLAQPGERALVEAMADVQGSYDDAFRAVPAVLARLLDEGDVGGSVAVFVDGEPVVDVWGGYADAGRTA